LPALLYTPLENRLDLLIRGGTKPHVWQVGQLGHAASAEHGLQGQKFKGIGLHALAHQLRLLLAAHGICEHSGLPLAEELPLVLIPLAQLVDLEDQARTLLEHEWPCRGSVELHVDTLQRYAG